MAVCRICGNSANNKTHIAQEMMFGFRDKFAYLECGQCGCVQLLDIPADMARYYPSNYYSFGSITYKYRPFKIFLKKQLIKYRVYKKNNLIGKFLSLIYRDPEEFYPWFEKTKLTFDAAILDVGCGSGQLLLRLRKSGYVNVRGVDPFIAKDINYASGITISKKSLNEVSGQYDLIIFNHVLEHLPNQQAVLQRAYNLLKPGGAVVVVVPVAGTYAWKTYGVNWVQLDAPRHLFLHTIAEIWPTTLLGIEPVIICRGCLVVPIEWCLIFRVAAVMVPWF